MVNGENDGFPGMVVDRYTDTLVVKVYTSAWFPYLKMLVGLSGRNDRSEAGSPAIEPACTTRQ